MKIFPHSISSKSLIGHFFVVSRGAALLFLLLLFLFVTNVGDLDADAIEFVIAIFVLPIANAIIFKAYGPVSVEALFEKSAPVELSIRRPYFSEIVTLLFFILAIPILYFDFSLSVEPLHYLTNIAPAFHIYNGGILLNDTFSQYGPGPMVATYLAGLFFGFSFSSFVVLKLFHLWFFNFLICGFPISSFVVFHFLI